MTLNIFGDLKIRGGDRWGVFPARTFAAFILLAFSSLASSLPAQTPNGNYSVSESWTVSIETWPSPPVVYSGTETGTLTITNGQYSLIDHTGIPGGDTNNTQVHAINGGPPYTILGEYPYAATSLSTNGFVAVMHLAFFSIGIPRSSLIEGTLVSSKSSVYTTTGQALTGLESSGSQDISDYYIFNASSTSSLSALQSSQPPPPPPPPAPFFTGEDALGNNWYYLSATTNNLFGYYSMALFPYVYHQDMGFEYFIDAQNAAHGGYFYDFASSTFWYSDPTTFPYLYDFSRNAWLFYLPDSNNPGRYTSNPRWFYDFSANQWTTNLAAH